MENIILENEEEPKMEIFDCESKVWNEEEEVIIVKNDAYNCNELSKFLDINGFILLDGVSSLCNGNFRFLFNVKKGCLRRNFKNIDVLKHFLFFNGFDNIECNRIKLNLPVNANKYYEVIIKKDCKFFSDSECYMHVPEQIAKKMARKKKTKSIMNKLSMLFVFLFMILILLMTGLAFSFKDKNKDFESIAEYPELSIKKRIDSELVYEEKSNQKSNNKHDFQYYEYDIEIVDSENKVHYFPYSNYEINENEIIIRGYSPEYEYYRPVSFMVFDKKNIKTISGKKSEVEKQY